ncbi:MAG: hypothetical protein HOP34_13255 [Methylococcaceae bacterium]|nr:hypothetical protein [Methylococcaceae bacterium]
MARMLVNPTLLKVGDQITIGDSVFKVALSRNPIPSRSVFDQQHDQVQDLYPKTENDNSSTVQLQELPRLAKGQRLDLEAIRDPYEKLYLPFVWLPTLMFIVTLGALAFLQPETLFVAVGASLGIILLTWISWKLLTATLLGDCIKVGPKQYPQIYGLISDACEILNIQIPDVYIMQGQGLFEVFVARYFLSRGFLILTSNLVDDLTENGSSRELMFFIGRQLGLIARGYFDFWFFKHFLGQFAGLFYLAWQRRCHFTADRLGLLVAGDLDASELALCIITVGSGVATNTNLKAVEQQRRELRASFWGWINLGLSSYPYMVERICRLRKFAEEAAERGLQANSPIAVAALPLRHRTIRALPLMIIHGHDTAARLEIENFLLKQFPHVALITMINEVDGAYSLPEKFERIAGKIKGAVALLTPDDIAMTLRNRSQNFRSRQNVIMEIGWMWGRLGREHCLLLTRGDVEVPSDLAGVELHRFHNSPIECSEMLRNFISQLEMR